MDRNLTTYIQTLISFGLAIFNTETTSLKIEPHGRIVITTLWLANAYRLGIKEVRISKKLTSEMPAPASTDTRMFYRPYLAVCFYARLTHRSLLWRRADFQSEAAPQCMV